MASDEDNFDIDIYGDGGEDLKQEPDQIPKTDGPPHVKHEAATSISNVMSPDPPPSSSDQVPQDSLKQEPAQPVNDLAQKITSTDESAPDPVQLPKQAPQTQGLKRKDGVPDDRFVDPGATTALFVSDLHWWVNDDDVRGWANQSQCEDELEDITFSEHKVNGKSKGQAYVLFKTPQAATAVKQKIESFGGGQQYTKKFTVGYTNPYTNPFRTLPKDGPARNNGLPNNNRSTGGGYNRGGGGNLPMAQQSTGFSNASFRGGRGGGHNHRGGGMGFNPMYTGWPMGATQYGGMMGGMRGGFMPTMPGFYPYAGANQRSVKRSRQE